MDLLSFLECEVIKQKSWEIPELILNLLAEIMVRV